MPIQGVNRLLYFKREANRVLTPAEFEQDPRYGFEPDGINFYYGLNDYNLEKWGQTGRALNFDQREFFEGDAGASGLGGAVGFVLNGAAAEKLIVLSVEPPGLEDFRGHAESGAADPFGFVLAHLDLVTALAEELDALQRRVREQSGGSRQLSIVVRFASEMNDRPRSETPLSHNSWGHQPEAFKQSFRSVRTLFLSRAPGVLFTFSPSIRADLNPSANPLHPERFDLPGYWPGDDVVDSVSATWYADGQDKLEAASQYFTSYFLQFEAYGKPLGVDEIGGLDNSSNDAMLHAMVDEIRQLTAQGMAFSYLSFFLEGGYGYDADLSSYS